MSQTRQGDTTSEGARSGVLFALAAMVIWGLSPLGFAELSHVLALEVVAHRILWSLPVILGYALLTGRGPRLRAVASSPRHLRALALSTALISVNWVVFVYAVQIGKTAEASFGYYLYPITVVVLGAIFFRERITALQWLAAAIAASAVLWLMWRVGVVPWIALLVTATFAFYGVVRKASDIGPLVGVTWEVMLVTPFLLGYLLYVGGGAFGSDAHTTFWLIAASLFTGVPLVMFVEAAKRLAYSTVGVIFYLNPTLQFVSALILGEAMSRDTLLAFGVIWVAVALYCWELRRRA